MKEGGMTKGVLGIVVLVIVLVGAAVLFGKGGTQEPLKVGVILPLTGEASSYGESQKAVMELAVEKLNASGGIKGRDMQLIFEDGKCSGKDAASAMQKLANVDKVKVVIGGFCSGESLAAEPIATENEVMLFSPSSSNPGLTGISLFFARNYPSDSSQGALLANVAIQKDLKTVAVLQEQTDYAAGIYGSFDAALKAKGGNTIKEEFSPQATDFRSSLAKLAAAQPDALLVVAQTPAAEQVLFKQLKEFGWKGQLFVNDVPAGDKELLAANKELLEGAITAEFTVDANNPKFKEMMSVYQAKFSKEPELLTYAQTEWDSVFLIAEGIRTVGYNSTKLANWIRTSVKNWQGASGSLTIGPDGDPTTGHKVEIIKNGKPELYK